jgi:lipopolysaccharide transport system ATP-binding protein
VSDIAIRVESLGKQYRIGTRERYQTLRDALTDTATSPVRWVRSLFRPSRAAATDKSRDLFWALKDVSFEVPSGAVVGIIGRNGAGKSTLLKILSRITEPTAGRVEVHGRVGSLLEVGTGFHPELTGRENIFLNGAILGMRRSEIVRKFDEIVAFAEVEKFIDTPVKHFSSGMYMRLAFAVAAHLETEILMVDEVLAVGDAQFQKRCLGKMGDVAKDGRTVLFVSHNMVAVNSLCKQALCLSSGRLTNSGDTAAVVAAFLRDDSKASSHVLWTDAAAAPGDDVCRIQQVQILTQGVAAGNIPLENPIEICVTYWNQVARALLNVSLTLYNSQQVCVFNVISPPREQPVGLIRETCEIPGGFLNTGVYHVHAMVVRDTATVRVNLPDIVSFEIYETARSVSWYGQWSGLVRPTLTWRTQVAPAIEEVAV